MTQNPPLPAEDHLLTPHLVSKMHAARTAKDFMPLIARLKSSDDVRDILVRAWGYKCQSESGVHIDDVHEDAENAAELIAQVSSDFQGSAKFGQFEKDLARVRKKAKAFAKAQGLPIRKKINSILTGPALIKKGFATKSVQQHIQYFAAALRKMDATDEQFTEAELGYAYGLAQDGQFPSAAPHLVDFVRNEKHLPTRMHYRWYRPFAQMALRCAISNNDPILFRDLWTRAMAENQKGKVKFDSLSIMWSEMLQFAMENDQDDIAKVIFGWMEADAGENWHIYSYSENNRATYKTAAKRFGSNSVRRLNSKYKAALKLFRK